MGDYKFKLMKYIIAVLMTFAWMKDNHTGKWEAVPPTSAGYHMVDTCQASMYRIRQQRWEKDPLSFYYK